MSPRMTARRAIFMLSFIVALFVVIGVRFWSLEVVHGTYYQSLARQDYLREIPVPSPRGNIVTADGVTIATSRPAWSLYYLNQGGPLPTAEVQKLSRLLGTPASQITQTIAKALVQLPSYEPIQIASDLTDAQMTAIEENLATLPNLIIRPIAIRSYPFNSVMGNILGYIGYINQQQYQQLKNQGFSINSLIGQAGLEEEYNTYLHGHGGGVYAEVNSQGQLVRLFGQQVPTPGDTLHLTINWRLEETAQKALAYDMYAMQHANPASSAYSPGAQVGAVVALNPNNGDILAMASLPSYNPNKMVPNTPGQSQYVQKVLNNPLNPLLVRPIYQRYSPGSIFKPIMAVAALASGTVTPTTEIFDPGYFPKLPSFHNWYSPGFGWLNIEQAIGLSDDVFFYTLGYDMGIQTMDHWMEAFLLNKPTGIDLPDETTSIVPTPQYLQKQVGVPWTWGWNLNTAIGQGLDQFTLIALARADSAIANGGTLYWPHLVSEITSPSGKVVKKFHPVVQGHVSAPAFVWQTVYKGMELSAQDPNIKDNVSGTGYGALAGFPIPLASKTGTAQVTGRPNNAFFLTYGPMPHPKILIIVYVRSGNWGANSGFVARAIYDQYFKVKDPEAQTIFDQTFGRPFAWPFGYQPPQPKGP
ncbi:penicillin-binding protein 2 [Sulfobacillus acidophilus DSM 10332]|uniref:Penicillin-binding protein 2 n=1 Tax=Sulfobacillus acidophilus (strain ATCC 700253 / DSM 10332 / NAL) TaxID=679936 RepID=G8TWX1_SULAD|nr:penicillin-binding protein 2 [Sulfobacillus acidophilus DSM 10332]